jgi:histone H3/H4
MLSISAAENWKIQTLPLARVKKIMKSEEIILQELEKERLQREASENGAENQERANIKFMISGEAPVLMSKACELLIKDLSFRAWQHTERNRRRTLQRQDLHAAVGESEVYDFLIDIVPRVQAVPPAQGPAAAAAPAPTTTMNAPEMSFPTHLPPGLAMSMNMNPAVVQHSAPAMAGIPVGAPQPATQQTAAPVAGIDTTITQAGLIQYGQSDALNNLPWDPAQLTYPPMPATDGADNGQQQQQQQQGQGGAPQQQQAQQQQNAHQWVDPTTAMAGLHNPPPPQPQAHS